MRNGRYQQIMWALAAFSDEHNLPMPLAIDFERFEPTGSQYRDVNILVAHIDYHDWLTALGTDLYHWTDQPANLHNAQATLVPRIGDPILVRVRACAPAVVPETVTTA